MQKENLNNTEQENLKSTGAWFQQKEKGTVVGLTLLLALSKFLPSALLFLLTFPVGLFYFLFLGKTRRFSKHFLSKVAPLASPTVAKQCRSNTAVLQHIISFCFILVEKVQTWQGNFPFDHLHFQQDDVEELIKSLEQGQGAVVICSHLGNAELLRGLAHFNKTRVNRPIKITSLNNIDLNSGFMKLLKSINPKVVEGVISSSHLGPEVALQFEERLAQGGLVVLAGDRVSHQTVHAQKNINLNFLGSETPFPMGVFYLATLLKKPIYFFFALRQTPFNLKPHYTMHVHKCEVNLEGNRKERQNKAQEIATQFATYLEKYTLQYPLQWYNFYNFWSEEK